MTYTELHESVRKLTEAGHKAEQYEDWLYGPSVRIFDRHGTYFRHNTPSIDRWLAGHPTPHPPEVLTPTPSL